MVGELYIGGAGVAAGYRNRPELTAARFLAEPAGKGRMYRTGDLALERPDGLLEYRSRDDGQVKVLGFRVELAEIEAVALRSGGIRAAAAYLRADGASLGLVVAGEAAGDPELSVLAGTLAAELPSHARPATLRSVPAIPLLPTGKIDRQRLAAVDRQPVQQVGNQGEPMTPTERRVLRVWQQRLNRSDIGREDDFFEVGGHSLLAAQVVSALRRELAAPLTIGDLFAHPTVAGVAAVLDQHAGAPS